MYFSWFVWEFSGSKHAWLPDKSPKFEKKGSSKVKRRLKNIIKFDFIKNDIKLKTYPKKIKAKKLRYGNMKNQNTERWKPSFPKKIGRKYRPIWNRIEQNNDHTRIMHKMGQNLTWIFSNLRVFTFYKSMMGCSNR